MNLGAASAALVAKNAQNMMRRAVGDDISAVNRLAGWLRRLVAADDPAAAATALTRLEETPEDHERLHELARLLNRRATTDAAFRSDLQALINQARADDLDLDMITRMAWGSPDPLNQGD